MPEIPEVEIIFVHCTVHYLTTPSIDASHLTASSFFITCGVGVWDVDFVWIGLLWFWFVFVCLLGPVGSGLVDLVWLSLGGKDSDGSSYHGVDLLSMDAGLT